jgi:hypothetical protein
LFDVGALGLQFALDLDENVLGFEVGVDDVMAVN